MSEKKRIKWKLNLFDIGLIVAAVAVVAVIAAMKLADKPAPADPNTGVPAGRIAVNYVVELEQLHEQTARMAAVGDQLYERTKREGMGVVQEVEVQEATTLTKNELEGTFQFVTVPERYNVLMKVSAQGTENDGAITLDSGLEVRAGTSVRVLGPGYYGAGYIITVERG